MLLADFVIVDRVRDLERRDWRDVHAFDDGEQQFPRAKDSRGKNSVRGRIETVERQRRDNGVNERRRHGA